MIEVVELRGDEKKALFYLYRRMVYELEKNSFADLFFSMNELTKGLDGEKLDWEELEMRVHNFFDRIIERMTDKERKENDKWFDQLMEEHND